MFRKSVFLFSLGAGLAIAPTLAAQEVDAAIAKHQTCLESIADDADEAFEDALQWRTEGGGRRANHCIAMALFALGHEEEAARRLEAIAEAPDGGTSEMRAGYYAEATQMWLDAGDGAGAYRAANKGLQRAPEDAELYILRARAYAVLEKWEFAQIDLDNALTLAPDNPHALRYRAHTKLEQGDLDGAKADIDRSTEIDIRNIDTLLLRGQINEAIRLETPSEREGD